MLVGGGCGATALGRALEEAELQEVGLVDVFDGVGFFRNRGGDGADADGAAAELLDDGVEDLDVDLVEALVIDVEAAEGGAGAIAGDHAAGHDLGVVAHAAQEAVGDAGRAAGAAGDFRDALLFDRDAEHPGRAPDDIADGIVVVVVEAVDGAEAVAQGRRHHGVARGGADEGESGQVQAHAAGAGPLTDDEVEGEVLHGGVEDLLHGAREPVHFIDEQDVTGFEVGENGREVSGTLDGGAGGDASLGAHLVGDNGREGRLAEAGWAVEQHVVQGLAALTSGRDGDAEGVLDLGLADVLGKALGPQRDLTRVIVAASAAGEDSFIRHSTL